MKSSHRTASRAKRSPGRYQADPASIYRLMNKIQPFSTGELLRLNMPVRMSYESLRCGRGVDDDFTPWLRPLTPPWCAANRLTTCACTPASLPRPR